MSPRRFVLGLLLLTLAAGGCAVPSLRVMEEHGVNVACYQLARTTGQASEYNRMLGGEGRDAARTALWWDFPLLVSYGLLLAVICLGVATRPRRGAGKKRVSSGKTESVELDELVECWTLLDDEHVHVAGKRGATRLAFALLLKFYIGHGRFLAAAANCRTPRSAAIWTSWITVRFVPAAYRADPCDAAVGNASTWRRPRVAPGTRTVSRYLTREKRVRPSSTPGTGRTAS